MSTLTVENWKEVVSESLSAIWQHLQPSLVLGYTEHCIVVTNPSRIEVLVIEQTSDGATGQPILSVSGEMFKHGNLQNFAIALPSDRTTECLTALQEMIRRMAWPVKDQNVESSQIVHATYSVPAVQQELRSTSVVGRAEVSQRHNSNVTVTGTPRNVVSYVSTCLDCYGHVRIVAVRFLKDNVPMTLKLTPDEAKKLSDEIDMTLTYNK